MKNTTLRFTNGKQMKTMKSIQLTGPEFALDVTSTDGRHVKIIFHTHGSIVIRTNDKVVLEWDK